MPKPVPEQLQTIKANVLQNRAQLEAQIPQLETQLAGAREQLGIVNTLISGLDVLLDSEANVAAVEAVNVQAAQAAAEVAGSPPSPAASAADAQVAGDAKG